MFEVVRGRRAKRHGCGEDGASAVEYGLLLSGIAAVVVSGVMTLGGDVAGLYDRGCRAFPAADCG